MSSGGEYGKVYKRIWGDGDFKALTTAQQLQYLKLISQTDVSMAGILTHAAMRWAGQTADAAVSDIEQAICDLEAARFVACDRETQEVLIRSYIRNDGGWKSPLTMKGIRSAVERILSPKLRRIISAELVRIDTSGLSEKVSERYSGTVRQYVEGVIEGLTKGYPPLELQAVNTPSEGVCEGVSEGGHAFARITTAPAPAVSPAVSVSPALRESAGDDSDHLPVPITSTDVAVPSKAAKGHRLPDGWTPARTPGNEAAEAGRAPEWLTDQLERFRDHWAAASGAKGVKADWDATWRNWIKRADDFAPRKQAMTGANLTGDDWDRWMAEAAAKDANNDERRTA